MASYSTMAQGMMHTIKHRIRGSLGRHPSRPQPSVKVWMFGDPGGVGARTMRAAVPMNAMAGGDNPCLCAKCHGSGMDEVTKAKCPVCGGRGVSTLEGQAIQCAFCGGRGTQHFNHSLACGACGGRGIITVGLPAETCPTCGGTGRDPKCKHYCITCKGAGVVTVGRRQVHKETTI